MKSQVAMVDQADEGLIRRLRAAVYARDGASVVGVLRDAVIAEVPQLAGDGLVIGLGQRVPGADRLARSCITLLRERASEGDDDLAAELEAALGAGPQPLLRPIPVDLDELADALEGDPMLSGGRLDLRTGDIGPGAIYASAVFVDEVDGEDDEEGRWLDVEPLGSGEAYRDMERFTATIEDTNLVELLEVALDGGGAFGRFKSVLARHAPDELKRWYRYNGDRSRGRARAWLGSRGYRRSPVPRDAEREGAPPRS